ncbi:hypothetical protein ACUXPL_000129 [Micrococcus sp. 140720015-1]
MQMLEQIRKISLAHWTSVCLALSSFLAMQSLVRTTYQHYSLIEEAAAAFTGADGSASKEDALKAGREALINLTSSLMSGAIMGVVITLGAGAIVLSGIVVDLSTTRCIALASAGVACLVSIALLASGVINYFTTINDLKAAVPSLADPSLDGWTISAGVALVVAALLHARDAFRRPSN